MVYLLNEVGYRKPFSNMSVVNGESIGYYTLNDNLDIVNNKYVIALTMVGVVITINLDLEKVIIICFTGL